MAERWLKVGVLGSPHGLKGGFYLSGRDQPLADGLRELSIGKEPGVTLLQITANRLKGSRTILHCDRFRSREDLLPFRGQPLWARRDAIPLDPDQEYLWEDVRGMEVVDAAGELMGTVIRMENHGASDIVVIRAPDSRSRLSIPLVSACFRMDFKPGDTHLHLLHPGSTSAGAREDA